MVSAPRQCSRMTERIEGEDEDDAPARAGR